MPAAYFWCPDPESSDFLATTAGNWVTGPATNAPEHTTAPGANDDLYFQGNVSIED